MLTNTFCHIKGITEKTEQKLWQANVHTWDAVVVASELPVSAKLSDLLKTEIQHSQAALANADHSYFHGRLPSKLHWRAFPAFKDSTVYLDIETTGLEHDAVITTCVLYDGKMIRHYVNGQNLADVVRDLQEYTTIVTYNGKCFDIPFMERFFGVRLPHAQIDLRYVLASLGYSGGLKNCEKHFGLDRAELAGVDGFFAVLLWREYKRGNSAALETLLAYNAEDVVNLEYLMHHAYNLKLQQTPFATSHALDIPVRPTISYIPDTSLIKKLAY